MNKTESEFALLLNDSPTVEVYWFDAVSLRLGPNLHYRPDFLVLRTSGLVTFAEVKGGFIREDALVKFKAASTRFPNFRWEMWQKTKKEGWKLKHLYDPETLRFR